MLRTTQSQAAHFILQKNYLTNPGPDLVDLVKAIGGAPGDPPLTPFLAAYARLNFFKPKDLLKTLSQNGRLVKSPLLRGQRCIVARESFPTFYAATIRQRRRSFNATFRLWDIENSEIERLSAAIVDVIGTEPLSAAAIIERLAPDLMRELTQTSRGGRTSKISNVALALRWSVAEGRLYAGLDPEKSTHWRQEEVVYGPLSHWQPGLDLRHLPDEAQAQADVARAYLAAFGPATEADISFWTGFSKAETARAVSALSAETTMTLIEGIPGMTLLLTEQAEALDAAGGFSKPVVNILPANDPFTIAYRASRGRYFSDQSLQRQVFNSRGEAKPVILVNGRIVGVWGEPTAESFGMIDWRLLTGVEATVEPLIEAAIERVEKFLT